MNQLNISGRLHRLAAKQLVVAGVFALAVAGSIGLGLSVKQSAAAAGARDCSPNSVNLQNLNGGCGALSPAELVADMRQNNPGDLQATYSAFGLSPDKYARFASSARMGTAYRNGDVVVDGQKVMTNAWSIGRTKFSYSSDMRIGNTMFHKSMHTSVLKSDMPVMVMFNGNGVAEAAVLTACGNPVSGNPTPSNANCQTLNMTPVSGKANTYRFTTNAPVSGNATITKLVYTFSDGTKVEKLRPTDVVEKSFTKSGTAKVEVHVKLPGNQIKVYTSVTCTKQVTVTPPKEKPPVCKPPGQEREYPVGSPECLPCDKPGKEHLPKESPECEEKPVVETPVVKAAAVTELPKTGPADLLGIFAGTSAAGAVVHRVISNRRNRR